VGSVVQVEVVRAVQAIISPMLEVVVGAVRVSVKIQYPV
jgi:hypothetical protein